MRNNEDRVMTIACILLAGGMIALGVLAYREHMACIGKGGHWSRENCRMVWDEECTTSTSYDGKRASTVCVPYQHEACDSVCRGLPAEAP